MTNMALISANSHSPLLARTILLILSIITSTHENHRYHLNHQLSHHNPFQICRSHSHETFRYLDTYKSLLVLLTLTTIT